MTPIGGANRLRATDCGRVNARSPSSPWTRPNPESPTPPNGSAGMPANAITELTETMPHRSRAAISAPPFLANTVAPRP